MPFGAVTDFTAPSLAANGLLQTACLYELGVMLFLAHCTVLLCHTALAPSLETPHRKTQGLGHFASLILSLVSIYGLARGRNQ